MCYVIVTSRTLLWSLLTIASTLAMLAAISTPYWLMGPHRLPGLIGSTEIKQVESGPYSPTLGVYNRCTKIHNIDTFSDSCAPFLTGFDMPSDEFPNFWKASLVFFAIALILMVFTVITSVLGCCLRSIKRKSIFTISGTVQAVAGLFYVVGLVLYPAGWGSRRVKLVCGEDAEAYTICDCKLGWAFYLAIGGTVATFVCSLLSVQAEVSTSSDKVQEEISEGKNLICLL
uniref:Lipoma HMGIC fusion partner-like 2 protein n=1 Tax=Strigamia maritima TaxID=126957 RepID=T1JKX0_STRMM